MTRDTQRPANGTTGYKDGEIGLLSGLWEEAPFARLPIDAPAELRDLVEDIDNPKRVYAVHLASRRHNFQLLVQRYIVQLRDGCGCPDCTTPTCFTCRKRLVGKAPIRRYNTTSARTLAIYLASQDNPERGLCPSLRQPKGPPAALSSLLFVPTAKTQARDDRASHTKGHTIAGRRDSIKGRTSRPAGSMGVPGSGKRSTSPTSLANDQEDDEQHASTTQFSVKDRPVTKDYRSFAANMFGTVAFKMLEWLTPSGIEEMARQTEQFRSDSAENNGTEQKVRTTNGHSRKSSPHATPVEDAQHSNETEPRPAGPATHSQEAKPATMVNDEADEVMSGDFISNPADTKDQLSNGYQEQPQSTLRPGSSRANSTTKVRKASGGKAKRQLSVDTYTQEAIVEENYATLVRSPRLSYSEKAVRPLKAANGTIPRPISQLTTAGYFDDVSLERMPPLKPTEVRTKLGRSQMDGASSSGSSSPKDVAPKSTNLSEVVSPNHSQEANDPEPDSSLESFYPQALSRLSPDVVDLMCDVLQEDRTAEDHMLEPQAVDASQVRQPGRSKPLRRRKSLSRRDSGDSAPNLRLEWRLFVEQTLFYILSDPQRVVRSFTKKGLLYDSQTVWYCMLRLTRVAPTIVFHSLWMASAALFAPPKTVQTPRSPTAKLFAHQKESLSNSEAGCLLSICLHALVAAAPLVSELEQRYDMSRIRSHGLSLAGSGAVARQPADLCLQYDDAFSNDLAIRLARRLFAAITTRRCFDELNESNLGSNEEPDILTPLFSQLDLLNSPVYILDFSVKDRILHETRVSTLLLDWARAIMLHDWSGNPEVPGDGPIGGALALIEAMCKLSSRRNTLKDDADIHDRQEEADTPPRRLALPLRIL
jgi:hypothetical protein